MFEGIQKNLLEFSHFHDLCHKFFLQEFSNSSISNHIYTTNNVFLQQLLPYFPTIRGKLEETLQQTKLLCDTNIHCLAKITVLQQEKQELTHAYEGRIQQLETQVASLKHALDHQKNLLVNYNNFSNLHSYWKEILHATRITNPLQPPAKSTSSKTKSPENDRVTPQKTLESDNSLVSASFHQPSLNKEQMMEMEDICAKLLNWLSIDSYQSIMTSIKRSPSSSTSPLQNSLLTSLDTTRLTTAIDSPDSAYKDWTYSMIQKVKKVKEYCYHLVMTVQQDHYEKDEYHLQLKEQRQQKHRLYEKYIDLNHKNERLMMQNEEYQTIANNYYRKIQDNEHQLRQLFDLLLQQKHQVALSSSSSNSRPTSRHASPTNLRSSIAPLRSSVSQTINTQPVAVMSRSQSLPTMNMMFRSRTPSPQRSIPSSVTPPLHPPLKNATPHNQPSYNPNNQSLTSSSSLFFPSSLLSTSVSNPPPAMRSGKIEVPHRYYRREEEEEEREGEEDVNTSIDSLEFTKSQPRLTTQQTHQIPTISTNSSTASTRRYQPISISTSPARANGMNASKEAENSLTYSYSSIEDDDAMSSRQRSIGRGKGPVTNKNNTNSSNNSKNSNTTRVANNELDLTFPSTISLMSASTVPPSSSSNSSLHSSPKSQMMHRLPLLPEEIQQRKEQEYHQKRLTSSASSSFSYNEFVSPLSPLGLGSTSSYPEDTITLEELALRL